MSSPFRNNTAIPAAGSNYQYTADEVREYVKCAGDPVYFIRNYMKIINVDKGLIPFELYDFQEKMVKSYHTNRFNITMCSRQVGKSTTVIGYFLHYILFNVNVSACIAANKNKISIDLLSRLKMGYEYLPRFLQQGVVRWAATEIELENGSKVFAAATSSSAVRGGSYNLILLDEFAFVDENKANEFYASTFPTISSGKTTKVIMVSTPNGMNLFYKFWSEALKKKNDFVPISVNWREVPGRDEAWKQQTIRNCGGPEKFAQEFENSFLSSSYTLISGKFLETMVDEEPIEEDETGFKVFVEPQENHDYVLTVDTATGQGLDASAFSIIDVSSMPYRVVATYGNNRIKTMEYPRQIMKAADRYFTPWILIEINDIGRDIANILFQEYSYPRLMTVTMQDKRQGQKLSFGTGHNRHMGVRMTPGVKRSGCGILKALVENHQLIIPDYRIISEFSTFIQNGTVFEAMEGHHDDHVMTLVVFAWASLQPNFLNITATRALDSYTRMLEVAQEGTNPISEPSMDPDSAPMPVGILGNAAIYDFEDSAWLNQ